MEKIIWSCFCWHMIFWFLRLQFSLPDFFSLTTLNCYRPHEELFNRLWMILDNPASTCSWIVFLSSSFCWSKLILGSFEGVKLISFNFLSFSFNASSSFFLCISNSFKYSSSVIPFLFSFLDKSNSLFTFSILPLERLCSSLSSYASLSYTVFKATTYCLPYFRF